MTRRDWLAGAAAATATAVPAATSSLEDDALKRNEESVKRMLELQVTDPNDRAYGGYRDGDGIFAPGSGGGIIDALAPAVLHPRSKHRGSVDLMRRIEMAAKSLHAAQNEYGNFYLPITNYNSPPDTGFIGLSLAGTAAAMKSAGAREMLALIELVLKKAGGALAVGGVHTPNHRWVMSAALAAINHVFPDDSYVRRIDQWLAEGLDIDDDGQYTERSTVVYNPITNIALTTIAARLSRLLLLDSVRRNLNAMMYLLHPGYEVVTEISRRQDVNQKGDMASYHFPLRYLAIKDSNGQYATIANHFASRASLNLYMQYPELLQPGPTPQPIPDNYAKEFPFIQLARTRRGPVSSSILLRNKDRFFTLRRGDAIITAVRFASAFFGKAQFAASEWTRIEGGYRLVQRLEAPYYQPFDPPRRITTENYDSTRSARSQSEICHLEQSAEIGEKPDGFHLRIRAGGTDHVPVAVEINIGPGKLQGGQPIKNSEDALLLGTDEYAAIESGGDRIQFGPGGAAHRYVQIRGALPKLPGRSIYVTGETPFDHALTFTWA